MGTLIRTDVSIELLQEFKTILGINTVCDADTGTYHLEIKTKSIEMVLLDCISNSWDLVAILDGDSKSIFLTHTNPVGMERSQGLLA
ncbi:hypothetical protein [Oceanospirillum linum]|uniref:Uncharacterized protein n=1 Tax=Oceanospirillum linum TaxID=966 RepID=A0A1T1HC58_OCELI|nr:hypothetical protein [Oceanospirillum linum]OOV87458.1 hypothetical protein BTA35_0205280 [Oceanospirillum linum]SEF88492.1 hypothetical protein SAMN04489856_10319 [Oleiphilus messinensis]SMP13738.1 hypothetical protein SAMN06264348_102521 [Oceanospirillum linum]